MRYGLSKALCIAYLVVVGVTDAWAQSATFQGLGDLPGGGTQGFTIGVSADGTAVVGHSLSAFGDEAFLWTQAGGMVGLGDLPGGNFDSAGTMASNGGTVVVGYGSTNAGLRYFRWTQATGMVNMGDLPNGIASSFATGMSANGEVVSGIGNSASGQEGFRWTQATGLVGLGDLPGGAFQSSAWGTAFDGTVLFGRCTSAAGEEACYWDAANQVHGLGYLPGGSNFSSAHGSALGGAVIVGASRSSNAPFGGQRAEAFRWSSATGMVGLGDLPGGDFNSFANGCSADGNVVVGGSNTAAGQAEAYLWAPRFGMVRLEDHLVSLGVTNVADWTLENAHGISADGTVIVGYGRNPAGNLEPWIARIPNPNAPTVSGWGMSVLVLLTLIAATVVLQRGLADGVSR